jgi:hypothetical protein
VLSEVCASGAGDGLLRISAVPRDGFTTIGLRCRHGESFAKGSILIFHAGGLMFPERVLVFQPWHDMFNSFCSKIQGCQLWIT